MFLDDVFSGVGSVFKGAYDQVLKPVGEKVWSFGSKALDRVDRLGNVADKAIDASGNIVGGLGDLLSGNSNFLVYLGIGIIVVVALPTILQKVL